MPNNDRNQTKPRKKRPAPITYVSKRTGDSDTFFDVLVDMENVCIAISTLMTKIRDIHEPDMYTVDDYIDRITEYFLQNNAPRLLDGKNIRARVERSINKLNIVLPNNIGFGFEFTYDVNDGIANITSCTGTITLYTANSALVKALEDSEFWHQKPARVKK